MKFESCNVILRKVPATSQTNIEIQIKRIKQTTIKLSYVDAIFHPVEFQLQKWCPIGYFFSFLSNICMYIVETLEEILIGG